MLNEFSIFLFECVLWVISQLSIDCIYNYSCTGAQSILCVCLTISMSLCIYVTLSGLLRRFLTIICVANNFAQSMQLQATVSNPLIGSIICPSVHPSGISRAFFGFCICISLQCWGLASRCIYPHTGGLEDPCGVQSILYVCQPVHMFLCTYVSPSLCTIVRICFWQSFTWPVIARIACGSRLRGKIP